jgi:hypothetical protein
MQSTWKWLIEKVKAKKGMAKKQVDTNEYKNK